MIYAILLLAACGILFFGSFSLVCKTLDTLDRVVNRKHYDDYYDVQFPFTIKNELGE